MPFVATFIVLAFAGILDAGYLAYRHLMKERQPMVCPLGGECTRVTEGERSTLFGIRNEYLGLAYYLATFFGIVAALGFPQIRPTVYLALFLMTGTGVLYSGYLTFLQWKVIKAWCFYCLVSATITALLFINAYHLHVS